LRERNDAVGQESRLPSLRRGRALEEERISITEADDFRSTDRGIGRLHRG